MRAQSSIVLLCLCACGGSGEFVGEEDPMPCDPIMVEVEVPIAAEPAPVCGDGRATTQRTRCTRRCSEGCDTEGYCTEVECARNEERCDGEDLGNWRCAHNGFVGGRLGCNEDCTLDWGACLRCVERPGLRCSGAPFAGGRVVHAAVEGQRVLVLSRGEGEHDGQLLGGTIGEDLAFRPAPAAFAEGVDALTAWQGGFAYVSDGGLHHLALPGREVRRLGDAGAASPTALLVEDGGGGIAVLAGYGRQDGWSLHLYAADGAAADHRVPHVYSWSGARVLVLPVRAPVSDAPIDGGLVPGDQLVGSRLLGGIFVLRDGALSILQRHTRYGWAADGFIDIDRGRYQFPGEAPVELGAAPRNPDERPDGLSAGVAASGTVLEAFGGRLYLDSRGEPGHLGIYHLESSAP